MDWLNSVLFDGGAIGPFAQTVVAPHDATDGVLMVDNANIRCNALLAQHTVLSRFRYSTFRFSNMNDKIVLCVNLLWLAFCQRRSSLGVLPIAILYLGIEITAFFHGGNPPLVITNSDILELSKVNFSLNFS